MTGRNAARPVPAATAITSNSRSRLSRATYCPHFATVNYPHADHRMLHPGDSPHPPVSAGNFTVPATVLQGAQMTQIGAIMADIV
jgi:hypothetical protein